MPAQLAANLNLQRGAKQIAAQPNRRPLQQIRRQRLFALLGRLLLCELRNKARCRTKCITAMGLLTTRDLSILPRERIGARVIPQTLGK